MAKPRKRHQGDTSAPDAAQAGTGRQAIHGDHADYGDRVSQRAYELFLARGGVDGQDFDDWLAAERELTSDRQDDHRE
ncbi:MAG TPA: DUF2934 domain-containing protein [Vicinamibacterales bacterium]